MFAIANIYIYSTLSRCLCVCEREYGGARQVGACNIISPLHWCGIVARDAGDWPKRTSNIHIYTVCNIYTLMQSWGYWVVDDLAPPQERHSLVHIRVDKETPACLRGGFFFSRYDIIVFKVNDMQNFKIKNKLYGWIYYSRVEENICGKNN